VIAPYRVLFPIGAALALIGVAPWALYALGLAPWPGPLHRALMIRCFEQSFVLGFMLTAMPGLTHAERCRPAELGIAVPWRSRRSAPRPSSAGSPARPPSCGACRRRA